jgi:membrane protein
VVGAIFSTVAWELLTKVFTWYIGSGLVNYELVYGSLGAIVVLMFYFFLTNMIFLLGANLTAFMDQHQTQKSS